MATDQLHRDRAPSGPADQTPTDTEALDAYSTVVTSVAERLLPSVVQLRVMGRAAAAAVAPVPASSSPPTASSSRRPTSSARPDRASRP